MLVTVVGRPQGVTSSETRPADPPVRSPSRATRPPVGKPSSVSASLRRPAARRSVATVLCCRHDPHHPRSRASTTTRSSSISCAPPGRAARTSTSSPPPCSCASTSPLAVAARRRARAGGAPVRLPASRPTACWSSPPNAIAPRPAIARTPWSAWYPILRRAAVPPVARRATKPGAGAGASAACNPKNTAPPSKTCGRKGPRSTSRRAHGPKVRAERSHTRRLRIFIVNNNAETTGRVYHTLRLQLHESARECGIAARGQNAASSPRPHAEEHRSATRTHLSPPPEPRRECVSKHEGETTMSNSPLIAPGW